MESWEDSIFQAPADSERSEVHELSMSVSDHLLLGVR